MKKKILQKSTKSFKNLQVAASALSTKDYFEWCELMGLDNDTTRISNDIHVKIISGVESETDIEAILTITVFDI